MTKLWESGALPSLRSSNYWWVGLITEPVACYTLEPMHMGAYTSCCSRDGLTSYVFSLQALSCLSALAPLCPEDYMTCQGNTRILLLIEWCSKRDSTCHSTYINIVLDLYLCPAFPPHSQDITAYSKLLVYTEPGNEPGKAM